MSPITTQKRIDSAIKLLTELSKACDDGHRILEGRISQYKDQETSLVVGDMQCRQDDLEAAIELIDEAIGALQGKHDLGTDFQ